MAQTYAIDAPDTPAGSNAVLSGNGGLLIIHGVMTISSYVNGTGDTLDLAADRPNSVAKVFSIIFANPAGRDFSWDATTKKVLAYSQGATEVTNATNIGAVPFVAFCQPKA